MRYFSTSGFDDWNFRFEKKLANFRFEVGNGSWKYDVALVQGQLYISKKTRFHQNRSAGVRAMSPWDIKKTPSNFVCFWNLIKNDFKNFRWPTNFNFYFSTNLILPTGYLPVPCLTCNSFILTVTERYKLHPVASVLPNPKSIHTGLLEVVLIHRLCNIVVSKHSVSTV